MAEIHSSLIFFFIFAFAINGLLAISILILKNKPFRIAHVLLAINLAGFALAPIMISLVESLLILEIPHFYRLPSPLYYASFPAGYLYVRMIIRDENELKWQDYLHFIPAVLHLIEMTPFYLLDTGAKVTYIDLVLTNKLDIYALHEGWLPPYIHNILRGLSAITYAILMWRILVKFKQKQLPYTLAPSMVKWLKLFTLDNAMMGVLIITLLTASFIPNQIRYFTLSSCLFVGLVTVNFFLFFRPEILYGLPQPVLPKNDNMETNQKKSTGKINEKDLFGLSRSTEIPVFIYEYKVTIDNFLNESKRYLDPEFNMQDLSRETGLPKHHLQLLIYKAEKKRFVEFINQYRIGHLKNLIDQGDLRIKTLDALAADCGFNSKATFFRTIKKVTGKTPKEYFHDGKE
jgi:AraC-like DNA-binding protein